MWFKLCAFATTTAILGAANFLASLFSQFLGISSLKQFCTIRVEQ
jgi:hypothetical protein